MSARMRRALASVSLGAVLAASGSVLIVSPASAAWTDCTPDYACMWQLGSYGTGGPDASFLVSLPYMNKSNDKVNSVVNRGYTSRARFYEGANYSGLYITLNREGNLIGEQWRDPNLSNGTDATTANWANRISSGKFVA